MGDGPTRESASTPELLGRRGEGRREAVDHVFDQSWIVLRNIARGQLSRERNGRILTPGALVNEAYLKLVAHPPGSVSDRRYFLRIASRAMRQVLVSQAMSSNAAKRRPGRVPVAGGETGDTAHAQPMERVALDRALRQLGDIDPRWLEIVELRFFAGLTVDEIAGCLGLSPSTVTRESRLALGWLRKRLV